MNPALEGNWHCQHSRPRLQPQSPPSPAFLCPCSFWVVSMCPGWQQGEGCCSDRQQRNPGCARSSKEHHTGGLWWGEMATCASSLWAVDWQGHKRMHSCSAAGHPQSNVGSAENLPDVGLSPSTCKVGVMKPYSVVRTACDSIWEGLHAVQSLGNVAG